MTEKKLRDLAIVITEGIFTKTTKEQARKYCKKCLQSFYNDIVASNQVKKEIIIKPFSLEDAANGAKVETKDGRPVRIIAENLKGIYPIAAIVDSGESEEVYNYTLKGEYYHRGGHNIRDLVIVEEPKKAKTYWVNVYKDSYGNIRLMNIYNSEKDAKFFATNKNGSYDPAYIKTISFTL